MGNFEPPNWLKSLPLAPEFRPTPAEFADPIAFISKIEAQSSQFGICKIIPPFPKPSKESVIQNLKKSLSMSPELVNRPNPSSVRRPGSAVFTTRQQELGRNSRRPIKAHKQVWQSGKLYTIEQFQAKARFFSKSILPKEREKGKDPFFIEDLFWKSLEEKPIYVEYANDVPGSGFSDHDGVWDDWNLQKIAKCDGSLTRFMNGDVPGVTSPMVYIGMLFSWFAWHVEDHELHSLNFLHLGSAKTWYAVPGSCAEEFEEVVRVHGYGGQVDSDVSFGLLGEKTTLVSPEIITRAGISCCRLVQNPGEFVVTFPRAYHVGFSHGFNCGEAANFATPSWLQVAKKAAVRRAAMNHLPMLSHQLLLYMLCMSYISRVPGAIPNDHQTEERETLVKKAFLDDLKSELHLVYTLFVNNPGSSIALWHPDLLLSTISAPRKSPLVNVDLDDDKTTLFSREDESSFATDVDAGMLTCTTCGILGYPFMTLLQPIRKSTATSATWDLLDPSMRPRAFCMEHAVHVSELLLQKSSSARVLVICHSDYLKIKACLGEAKLEVSSDSAALVLRRATVAELDLIDTAVYGETEEDWTSKIGFNLRNGVNDGQLRVASQPDLCDLEWRGKRARTWPSTKKRRGSWTKNSEEEPVKPRNISPDSEQQVVELKQYQRRQKKKTGVDGERTGPGSELLCTRSMQRATAEEQIHADGATDIGKADTLCESDPGPSCFARAPCEGLRPRNRPVQAAPLTSAKQLLFVNRSLARRDAAQHDRPLKCPWKGCGMSFKWAWARTEHIRVHTGERPYRCIVAGCGLTFRFISDFSRHRRRTGHCRQ